MPVLERVLRLLAPHTCVQCKQEGAALCEACRVASVLPVPPRCFLCYKSTRDFKVCAACKRKTPLSNVWVASEYEAPVKDVIRLYKFSFAREAHQVLAKLLDETLPYVPAGEYIVVNVPTATSRVRGRGFDQSALVAKRLAAIRGWRYEPLLVRTTQARQVGTTRKNRLSQMDFAFRIRRKHGLRYTNILLVDDVVTTGATINAAARALKNRGVKHVDAAIVAQSLPR